MYYFPNEVNELVKFGLAKPIFGLEKNHNRRQFICIDCQPFQYLDESRHSIPKELKDINASFLKN